MVMTAIHTGIPAMPYSIILFGLASYLMTEMSDTLWTQLNKNVEPRTRVAV